MQAAANIFGWLTARAIGLAALLVLAYQLIHRVGPALAGSAPFNPINLALAVCYALIALIFLVPSRTMRTLRSRQHPTARLLVKLVAACVVAITLSAAVQAANALFPSVREQWLQAVSLAVVIYLQFLWYFILPGRYAAGLAGDYDRARLGMTAGGAPEEMRAGPGAAATRYSSEADTAAWRDRALARHRNLNDARGADRAPSARVQGSFNSLFSVTGLLILAAVIFGALGLYGLRGAQFIPTAQHLAWAEAMRWPVVIGGTLILAVFSVVMPMQSTTGTPGPVRRAMAGPMIGAMLLYPLAITSMSVGLPGVHSLFVRGAPAEARVSVIAQGKRVRRRGCNRSASVRASAPLASDERTVCDIPEDIWERLRTGQVLILRGHMTPYGLRYETIQR